MSRKMRGILYLVTAALFAAGGGVMIGFEVTPHWVTVAVDAVAAVMALLGIPLMAKPEL